MQWEHHFAAVGSPLGTTTGGGGWGGGSPEQPLHLPSGGSYAEARGRGGWEEAGFGVSAGNAGAGAAGSSPAPASPPPPGRFTPPTLFIPPGSPGGAFPPWSPGASPMGVGGSTLPTPSSLGGRSTPLGLPGLGLIRPITRDPSSADARLGPMGPPHQVNPRSLMTLIVLITLDTS